MNARAVTYWISTGLFCAMMGLSAFMSLTGNPQAVQGAMHLGYPIYFMRLLGLAYALGIVALLLPGCPRLKEWAYAGFTFSFLAAWYSHVSVGESKEAVAPVVALIVLGVSFALRPAGRRFPGAA